MRPRVLLNPGLEKTVFKKKFLCFLFSRFLGFNYEDRTQNYDPEIHEESHI